MKRVILLKWNLWVRLATITTLLLLLSGCELISDPKGLMQLPQLPSDKQTLSSTIQAALPPGAKLANPKNGNANDWIQQADLDGDGKMEAIAFYTTSDARINGMIFEQAGSDWIKKRDIEGQGYVLESVEIKDITHDGHKDLIVGYSNAINTGNSGVDSMQKNLVIYSYNKGELNIVDKKPYTYYEILDMNGDGIDDLTTMYMSRNSYLTITNFRYKDGFQEVDSIDLDSTITLGFYNVVSGKVSKDQNGIIMDQLLGISSGFTHLIVMENNKLRDVFPLGRAATFKDSLIYSDDVNGDGLLEIGMLQIPLGWENIEPSEIPYFTYYYQWDGDNGLKLASQQYRDDAGRFVLKFAPEWNDKITLDTKSNKDQDLRFILKDTGEKVAEVRFFTSAQWANQASKDWELITTSNDQYIALWQNTKNNLILN